MGTIYLNEEAYGGGGGGNFETTLLWENTTGAGTGEKTLTDSIDNYDFISVWCGIYSEYTGSPHVVTNGMISVAELNVLHTAGIYYTYSGFDNRATYLDFYGNKVNVTNVYMNQTLLRVYGIKCH